MGVTKFLKELKSEGINVSIFVACDRCGNWGEGKDCGIEKNKKEVDYMCGSCKEVLALMEELEELRGRLKQVKNGEESENAGGRGNVIVDMGGFKGVHGGATHPQFLRKFHFYRGKSCFQSH